MPEFVSTVLAAAVGALLLYVLGKRAYVHQRQREELHDLYVRGGIVALQSLISRAYASFQANFEVVASLLRYMRDYDSSHPRQPTPDLIQEKLVEVRFPDELLSSSILVQSLYQSSAVASLTFQLMARLAEARIHQQEAMAVLRRFLANPAGFGDDPREFYTVLMQGMAADKERIAEALWISDRLGELQNRLFAAHACYATFTELQGALASDGDIQRLLGAIDERVDKIRKDAAHGYEWPPRQKGSSRPGPGT